MSAKKPVSVVHIVTVPATLIFFQGSAAYMKSRNIDLGFISSPGLFADQFAVDEQVSVHPVSMARRMAPLEDFRSLFQLWQLLRQSQPTIVHLHTPKASLLGSVASFLARSSVRIYHIHGLRYTTMIGVKRQLMRIFERLTSMLVHQVLCVSQSTSEQAIEDKIVRPAKIKVLHHGSICGIDAIEEFNPTTVALPKKEDKAIRIGFVGRLVQDKGIIELAQAWQTIKAANHNVQLQLVGPFEKGDPVPELVRQGLINDDQVQVVGYVEKKQMPSVYASLDMLVLPTYREGFGQVLLEASAMEVPVIASRIPGCVDAVVDGVTGTLVPVRDAEALANAIQRYIDDPALRRQHGLAGRERVLRDFRPEDIWAALYDEYERLLIEKGIW